MSKEWVAILGITLLLNAKCNGNVNKRSYKAKGVLNSYIFRYKKEDFLSIKKWRNAIKEEDYHFLNEANLSMNLNSIQIEGVSPLQIAVNEEKIDIIKYMIEVLRVDPKKADVNGRKAIHYAALKGNKEIVKYLWKLEGEKNDKKMLDKLGNAPIFYAIQGEDIRTTKYLLKKTVYASYGNWQGMNLSMIAAKYGNIRIMKLIRDYVLNHQGIDLFKLRDLKGRNIVMIAIDHNQTEVVKYLVNNYKFDIKELLTYARKKNDKSVISDWLLAKMNKL